MLNMETSIKDFFEYPKHSADLMKQNRSQLLGK